MPAELDILQRIAATLEEIRCQGADPEESMTTAQVASFLKVDKGEVLRYVKLGLPYLDGMGKGFKFIRRDVIAFRERYRAEQSILRKSRAA
jgi:hypothetical protein